MRIAIDPSVVASNFAKFKTHGSLAESAQLFARGLPVAEMLQAMSMNANVLQAFTGFDAVYPHGTLERPLVEKVILRVSELHDCQFCVNSHLDMMRALGVDARLDDPRALTAREAVALAYAAAVTRDSNRVPDALFESLRSLMTDAEIVELTFVIGLITMLNRFNNALQVRYSHEFAQVQVQ